MEKMKYDMAGGATMLGAIRALAALKPNVKVVCVVPSTENMPGGKAQKPGDIQTAMSGKTIEVLNTDAEGRLILADAIHYAKQLGVTHIVDAATLTGAIVVALANINVGVFGSDQAWTDKLLASAKATGEKMWQLPMDDEYANSSKAALPTFKTSAAAKVGVPSLARGSSANSQETLHGFTSISRALRGMMTPKPGSPKAHSVALRTLVHLVQSF